MLQQKGEKQVVNGFNKIPKRYPADNKGLVI